MKNNLVAFVPTLTAASSSYLSNSISRKRHLADKTPISQYSHACNRLRTTVMNTAKPERIDSNCMTLHFISKTVSVDGRSSDQLREHIEDVLEVEGDPVRWAIVEVDKDLGTCRVDAVVSRSESQLVS